MSPYEQKKEIPDNRYKYLLFASEPYSTIAFKIPNLDLESRDVNWDKDNKIYTLSVTFKEKSQEIQPSLPKQPGNFGQS